MNFRYELMKLGSELDREANAAHDLWSWLPSCKAAEKYHGDYHSEFMPSVEWVMREACEYLADLKHGREITEEAYPCPCDGEHHPIIPTKLVVKASVEGAADIEIAASCEVEPYIIRNILEYHSRLKYE